MSKKNYKQAKMTGAIVAFSVIAYLVYIELQYSGYFDAFVG